MKNRAELYVRRVCAWILRQSVHLYPPEKQSWGEAALAELQAAPTVLTVLRWTAGGVFVALRSYFVHVFWHPVDLFLGRSSLLRLSWRSLSPVFLLLSLGLFLVPQFRQAVDTTTSVWANTGLMPTLSDHEARAWQAQAEREHDAQTLAFLALRSTDANGAPALAENAIALDPSLTWILSALAVNRNALRYPIPPEWLDRLQRWEPDNAFNWLLQAQSVSRPTTMAAQKLSPEMLTGNQQFQSAMARAFASPDYDSYLARRFELDRSVLKKHGMEKPLLLMAGMVSHPLPNLYRIRVYAEWLIADGNAAMQRDRAQTAEDRYWQVVHFGQNMESHSYSAVERLVGSSLQQLAGRPLLPILRSEGKEQIAATLGYALDHFQRLDRRDAIVRAVLIDPKLDPWTENYSGVAQLVIYLDKADFILHGAAFAFVVSLVLSAVYLLYLRLHHARGIASVQLPRLIACTPPLLFSSALALLVSYLPYARIFHTYMADVAVRPGRGMISDFDPLWAFNKLQIIQDYNRALIWPVAIGLSVAVLLLGIYSLARMRRTVAGA